MKSKFLKLYNLIMEDLITSKSGKAINLKKTDSEYPKTFENFNDLVQEIVKILQNDPTIKSQLNEGETIECINKDSLFIIKCPKKIRNYIMDKTKFLTDQIESSINNNSLIDGYIFKINNVDENSEEAHEPFKDVDNDTDDIKFMNSSKSSAGEYKIPIIIRSDDNKDDFFKFNVSLMAKPNDGAFGKRDGNISITAAEFIPCFLWNINANANITIDEIIENLINYDFSKSKYFEHESSKKKIENLINYFKNKYQDDPEKKIINGKIYGAINIYKYMLTNFSDCEGECIWTDITALKPKGHESDPGDIMINNGDDYISISLKTAENNSQSPPLRNTTVKEFLNFCKNVSGNDQYNIKDSFYYPLINYIESLDIFKNNEINELRAVESSPKKFVNYVNNSKIGEECIKIGPIRDKAIELLINIINETFKNNTSKLMDYFLQIQQNNGNNNFCILKAIEKAESKNNQELVHKILLSYEIKNDFKIEATKTGIKISGFSINNTKKKLMIDVRTKGHGLHAYLSYDLVSALKDDK